MTREIDLTERTPPSRPMCSAAHDVAMQKVRDLLGAYTMPRQATWWGDLKQVERLTLARHAGLAPERAGMRWVQLDVEERQRILLAVERAAAWARELKARLA